MRAEPARRVHAMPHGILPYMRRWGVAGLLSIALAIAYIDRTNIAFAITSKDLIALFHLSDSDRGVLNSAFFWTYGILQVPSGYLVDRYGVKWPLAFGFFAWCLAGAACGIATTFTAFVICR